MFAPNITTDIKKKMTMKVNSSINALSPRNEKVVTEQKTVKKTNSSNNQSQYFN